MQKVTAMLWLKVSRKLCPNIPLAVLLSIWNHMLMLDKRMKREKRREHNEKS